MGFDRSKYKGVSVDKMKKSRKETEKKSFTKSDKTVYHQIESGKNVFRILPPHHIGELPFEAERKAFLKCEVPKRDESGELTGKSEIKNKAIFIATIHGLDKKGKPMTSDPIETYIKYVYKKANEEIQDKNEKDKFLVPITGAMTSKGYQPGLRPSTNYVYYAIKDGSIGLAKFYPTITKKMEEISLSAIDEDEPDNIDIFSDPDFGVNLEIIYNPKGKKGEKYIISKSEYNPKKYDSWEEFISSMRVSDEALKKFSEMKSLKELYGVGVYKLSDFNYALDGLQRFDEENEYEIFENEEFLTELEAIKDLIPETIKENIEKSDEKLKESFSKPDISNDDEIEEEEEEEDEEINNQNEPEKVDDNDVSERLNALKAKLKK